MDQTKISGLKTEPETEPNSKPDVTQWFWQSDVDPWKDNDQTKWKWKAYSYESCCIIEKALFFNLPIADLGVYEIDFKKMLQVNKADRSRIRRVRREGDSKYKGRFMNKLIPKTPIVEKDQKTMNDAFGDVQHFLNYIMHRTPEAFELYHRLKALNLSSKEEQYKDIMEKVVASIQRGAETREKVIKSRIALSASEQKKTFIFEAQCIVEIIKSKSRNLKEFLHQILKIYTMESFICYWLNEILRSENWEEVNVLTPYLICLIYTFKLPNYIMKYNVFTGVFLKLTNKGKLLLYRGATLTEDHLAYYNPQKNPHFSWNGVTSTSKSKNQAINFIKISLEKEKSQKKLKIGVLFIIETEFSSDKDCEGMIDVSQSSAFPHEEEVILAPGTVFELIKAHPKQKNSEIFEIELRIKRQFAGNQKDIPLLGTLLQHLEDKTVINNLTQEEIIKALQLLEGNQNVENLEIRNCSINSHLMGLIAEIPIMTNIKPENIHLMQNVIFINDLMLLPVDMLDQIFENNQVILERDSFETKVKEDKLNLKKIQLNEKAFSAFYKNDILKELFTRIRDVKEIGYLNLSINSVPDSENNILNVIEMIKELSYLKELSLDFEDYSSFQDNTVDHLKDFLQANKALEVLVLSFRQSSNITDRGLSILCEAIRILTYLKHLSLNFDSCGEITDDGLHNLSEILPLLKSLAYLDLNFTLCQQIADNGLENLSGSLKYLLSLKHLSLNFGSCFKITDKGLDILSKRLRCLNSLNNLSLHFPSYLISNSGLNNLSDALRSLGLLKSLTLSLIGLSKYSELGLCILSKTLGSCQLLNFFSLSFQSNDKITDSVLNSISAALSSLTSLNHLYLSFHSCDMITDGGLSSLTVAIKLLVSLKYLSLIFNGCSKIKGNSLDALRTELKVFSSLKHLEISQ